MKIYNLFKIIARLLIPVFFVVSCIKGDPTNISSDIAIQPEYSLPIGQDTIRMDKYVDNLVFPLEPLSPQVDSALAFVFDSIYYNNPLVLTYSIIEPFSFITFKDQLNKVKSLTLRTNVVNRIPARIELQVYFLDIVGRRISTLFTDSALIIPAAKIDDQGNVLQPGEIWEKDTPIVPISLENVQYITISTQFVVENSDGNIIHYLSTQEIWIQLGVRIAFDINLNDL